LIFHNSFISNNRETDGVPNSDWYSSDLKEGNFYTSYAGLDDGSGNRVLNDGIGDTEIPHNGRDFYPLMKDRYWEMPDIPQLNAEYASGTGTLNLSWTAEKVDGVLIQRATDMNFTRDLKVWSVNGDELTIDNNPNSTLFFRISGFNDRGFRGWSVPLRLVVDQAPLPPINIAVESLSEGSRLRVTWDYQGEDINRVTLEYSCEDVMEDSIEILFPEDERILDQLDNGKTYNISMYTKDIKGQISKRSENITGIPVDLNPPPPPRSPYARPISNHSVEVGWNPPLIQQDISGYVVYRRSIGEEFTAVANLSRFVIKYVDEGLEDNTSYEYGIATIDDDGPISKIAGPVKVTTFHSNEPPEFFGGIGLVYLVEDNGSVSIDLEDIAYDPDGDPVIISVEEYYPVRAEIAQDKLWIIPDPDQSGDGFIKIKVSDGEDASFLIMGVVIEPLPDPPKDVMILSPSNGSVLLPGRTALLLAEAVDPDQPYGDNLTYIWTSDLDGPLNGPGSLREEYRFLLSPGVHNITLEVIDSTGNSVIKHSRITVSLWGWDSPPWNGRLLSSEADEERGRLTVRIINDGPIQLSFLVSPGDQETSQLLGDRGILVSPSSTADIMIDMVGPFVEGEELVVNLVVRAETLNGTFAGEIEFGGTVEVDEKDQNGNREMFFLILLLVFSLIAIICLIIVFIVGRGVFFQGYRENLDEEEDPPRG
jgi:hypothetical protein